MYFHNKLIWSHKCEYYLLQTWSNVKHFNWHAYHSCILFRTEGVPALGHYGSAHGNAEKPAEIPRPVGLRFRIMRSNFWLPHIKARFNHVQPLRRTLDARGPAPSPPGRDGPPSSARSAPARSATATPRSSAPRRTSPAARIVHPPRPRVRSTVLTRQHLQQRPRLARLRPSTRRLRSRQVHGGRAALLRLRRCTDDSAGAADDRPDA